VKQYYHARAAEYDEWYLGLGRFAGVLRPDWDRDVQALARAIARLPRARTLDVACGTGYLSRHLRGQLTALDQSGRMLALAAERVPAARMIRGDALELPFEHDSFERVFTGHFYGHLEPPERARFVAEARRVAPELVVVDSARRPDHAGEEWQQRMLNDRSTFEIYKRYFDAEALAAELGGGAVLHAGRWFVMVSSPR
jgi:demethylmenaquinone methyltransferase/2-methoxy-6-polyprenyl-1,4-benzoquinol methylase